MTNANEKKQDLEYIVMISVDGVTDDGEIFDTEAEAIERAKSHEAELANGWLNGSRSSNFGEEISVWVQDSEGNGVYNC